MFYDRFASLCKARGLTPTAVVKAAGISTGSIGHWKTGALPKLATIRKLANYLGVDVSELTGGEQKEKPADEGGLVNSDIDLTEYLERLAKRPELRMLFSVTKDATKADVEKAVRIIEALRNEEQKK